MAAAAEAVVGGTAEYGLISLVPAACMLLGSAASCASAPSELNEARLQRLSAGLIIGAVAIDLFPELANRLQLGAGEGKDHKANWVNLLAGLVGFLAALVVMYALKSLELEDEELEDGEKDEEAGDGRQEAEGGGQGHERRQDGANGIEAEATSTESDPSQVEESDIKGGKQTFRRRISLLCDRLHGGGGGASRTATAESDGDLKPETATRVGTVGSGHSAARVPSARQLKRSMSLGGFGGLHVWPQSPIAAQVPIPWTVVLAVVMDAMVDGLLIGLTSAVNPGSSRLLAIATAIEMGVLGYSFARTVLRASWKILAVPVLFLPPLFLVAASAGAAASAAQLRGSFTLTGLLAFGLVALLFLIFEELIAEAHEVEGGDKWHVSIWLYLGLLFSIGLDAFL